MTINYPRLNAPSMCVICCESETPPEEFAEVEFVDTYPFLFGLSYEVFFTPAIRDPITNIVGTGYIRFTKQAEGELPDCSGCDGYQCVDDDGNPIPPYYGSAYGWLSSTDTFDVEFYLVSDADHGVATDLVFPGAWAHNTTMATNAPDCTTYEQFWDTITHTFTW